MTVGIGAKFPPGITPGLLGGRNSSINEVVIFAADTRYSWRKGFRPPENRGRKIFRLRKFLALAFAGDVAAAEDAIIRLRASLPRQAAIEVTDVVTCAQRCLSDAFKHVGRGDEGLWVLLGGRELSGAGYLVRLSHLNDFQPILLSGEPVTIGLDSTCAKLKLIIADLIEEKRQQGAQPKSAQEWLMLLYAALDFTLQARTHIGVGGRVQTGIVSEDGFWDIGMVTLEEVAVPPKKDRWRTAGHRLSDLRGYNLNR